MGNKAQDHEPFIEVSKITENIYLGSSMCCKKHESYHGKVLSKFDIYADIDLRSEYMESNPDVKVHVRLPVEDTYPPSIDQIEVGVEVIQKIVDLDKKVFVHCQIGHGRSPTLVIAYLMLKQDMDYNKAFEFVAKQRPEIHPTDRQVEFLKSLKSLV